MVEKQTTEGQGWSAWDEGAGTGLWVGACPPELHQLLTAPSVLLPLTFPPWLPEFLSSSTSSWDFHCLHSAFPGQLRPSRPSCLSHSFQPSQAPSERERATPCSRPHHPLTISPFWKPTPFTCTTLSSSSHCHPPRQGHVLALP